MLRANYAAEIVDGVICVEDLCAPVSCREDIDAVLARLAEQFNVGEPPTVILRGADGRWDGIAVVAGAFAGVVSMGARDRDRAVDYARRSIARGSWTPD